MITTFPVKLSILMILLDGCPICYCAPLYGLCVILLHITRYCRAFMYSEHGSYWMLLVVSAVWKTFLFLIDVYTKSRARVSKELMDYTNHVIYVACALLFWESMFLRRAVADGLLFSVVVQPWKYQSGVIYVSCDMSMRKRRMATLLASSYVLALYLVRL